MLILSNFKSKEMITCLELKLGWELISVMEDTCVDSLPSHLKKEKEKKKKAIQALEREMAPEDVLTTVFLYL